MLEWNLETDGTIWLNLWGGNRLLNVAAAMFAVMKKKTTVVNVTAAMFAVMKKTTVVQWQFS